MKKLLTLIAFVGIAFIVISGVVRPSLSPQPVAAKPKTYRPVKNDVRWARQRDLRAHGEIEIGNGNDHVAIVKLISQLVNAKLCVGLILPKSSLKINGIPDGNYRLEWALGNEIIVGTEKLWQPLETRRFNDLLNFKTTAAQQDNRIVTTSSKLQVTLHSVEAGNAQTVSLPAGAFDRD